jgi:hypothetical protein
MKAWLHDKYFDKAEIRSKHINDMVNRNSIKNSQDALKKFGN